MEANFPENALVYANQSRSADTSVNCVDNIEEYDCKPNEVKLNTPLYNIDSGGFLGLKKILAFIMVSGGQDEAFFSDGFAKAKSKKLYSTSKKLMPNIFSGTCFKKHQNFLVEQWLKQESSTLFFYLLSTTDFSHDINQFNKNVSLHPIGCLYEDFRQYSETGEDLESKDLEKRTKAAEIVRNFFQDATDMLYEMQITS